MAKDRNAKRSTHVADAVTNTFEWLITAFILAFVFRAFVMEAFRIPTGSMADTLKGANFRIRCVECGYRYDYGFTQGFYGFPNEYMPPKDQYLRPDPPRCPSCGFYVSADTKLPVASGDRILVLKTLYQFKEPDRWDVVVFKNPAEPRINYIKRMIARPGETLQLFDGDVYINNKIARKPPKIQDELWMPVYNNDYRPVKPEQPYFNGHTWRQPFENTSGSAWNLADEKDPSIFTLDTPKGSVSTVKYNPAVGNDFKAAYAYNESRSFEFLPIVSDIKLSFNADISDASGMLGIVMSKYDTTYKANLDPNGTMQITASNPLSKDTTILASTKLDKIPSGKFVPVYFSNVDHILTFKVGDNFISKDLGTDPNSAGVRIYDIQPYVAIAGSGKQTLSHIALYRDTYYLDIDPYTRQRSRASEKKAFTLAENEYFVMGDNSPNSADCRWWNSYGVKNNKGHYRMGIVPRDYMVGKAMMVYWPSAFKPFHNTNLPAIIPDFGDLRFIYGGVSEYN